MKIKFKLVRHGTGSGDVGPNGEVGFVLSGETADGKHNYAETVHCPGTAERCQDGCQKDCGQALLDAPCIEVGTHEVEDGKDDEGNTKYRTEKVVVTPRERITKVLADRVAAAQAEKAEAHKVKPLPKVERVVERNGKKVREQVEDRELS